jgi:hypothetical protein
MNTSQKKIKKIAQYPHQPHLARRRPLCSRNTEGITNCVSLAPPPRNGVQTLMIASPLYKLMTSVDDISAKAGQ